MTMITTDDLYRRKTGKKKRVSITTEDLIPQLLEKARKDSEAEDLRQRGAEAEGREDEDD